MIIGNLNRLELTPYLPDGIKKAILFIKNNVNVNTPNGKYEIDGDKVFFMVSDNKPRVQSEAYPEFHRRYIDVQIVLEGAERMDVHLLSKDFILREDRLEKDDIAFVENVENQTSFVLYPYDFAVFYPNELHKPLGQVSPDITGIKKVVIKVELDSL